MSLTRPLEMRYLGLMLAILPCSPLLGLPRLAYDYISQLVLKDLSKSDLRCLQGGEGASIPVRRWGSYYADGTVHCLFGGFNIG